MASIKDVAKLCGLSVTTVSRVMNNRGYISEQAKRKVHDAIVQLNYHPNQMAISLYRKKTNLIGLILPDISHVYYASEARWIEDELYKRGYKLLLCNAAEKSHREQDYIDMLQRNKVDGIIIGSQTLGTEDYIKLNLPIVALDRFLHESIPTVCADHEMGGTLAAQELYRNGCRNVIQIMANSRIPTPSKERHDAFRRYMTAHGAACTDFELGMNVFAFDEYVKVAEHIFDAHSGFDGVFAVDNVVCAVNKVAARRGVELKSVGYDGTEISQMVSPIITTIRQPVKEIARAVVETLINLIQAKKVESRNKIPVQLIKGETTR